MTQTLLTIFVPTFMVLVGILLNRNDTNRLDARITGLESCLDGRMSGLEARMSGLENRAHTDTLLIVGKLNELDVRIARLEVERQDK